MSVVAWIPPPARLRVDMAQRLGGCTVARHLAPTRQSGRSKSLRPGSGALIAVLRTNGTKRLGLRPPTGKGCGRLAATILPVPHPVETLEAAGPPDGRCHASPKLTEPGLAARPPRW